jgi:hypothetical protein
MRWGDMRESENVEDRTGAPGPGGGFPLGGGMRLGLGSLILILIGSWLFGVNPLEILGVLSGGPGPEPQQQQPAPGYGPQTRGTPGASTQAPPKSQDAQLSAHVLGDTEDVWSAVFKAGGSRYEPPKLVFFHRTVQSACGMASAAAGPFYCPGDRRLYLDTAFFQELHNRFGAPGDFAQAYVIAHEVGHHVQNLLGTMQQFDAQSRRMDTRSRNDMSVRLELQADCYAGVWGFFAQKRNLLESGDLEEGLRAAAAVGDDQIQKRTQGYAVPESFTHGSAQQRMRWFKVGFDSGDLRKCNTFDARS